MNTNQVATMARENSGTPAKLRTFGRLRGYTLQRLTRENGGATLDLSSEMLTPATHTSGYYVGGYGKVTSFPLISDVRPYITAIREAYVASGGSGMVGTWLHAGMVYAERSEHHESRFTAMHVARKLGQLEIFDIAAGVSIPVTPPAIKLPRK